MIRGLFRWTVRLVLVVIVAYAVSFAWVWYVSRRDERQPADAIVVLGAAQYNGRPSPVLRARLDHALMLYQERLAPVIVVTGGVGTGEALSEASVSHRYLKARAVPDADVVDRPEGRTTEASIASVASWAREHGVRHVLLVSDPFHMARLKLEASRVALHASTSPTRMSPITAGSAREWSYLALEALKVPATWARGLVEPRR